MNEVLYRDPARALESLGLEDEFGPAELEAVKGLQLTNCLGETVTVDVYDGDNRNRRFRRDDLGRWAEEFFP